MPRYETAEDIYQEKPLPKFKKPNTKFPKDEIDEELESIEKGESKPTQLSEARKFGGVKIKRPRFGGMSVGQ